eukprot:EG_transcript_17502
MATDLTLAAMLPPLDDLVREWLAEDIPHFDLAGAVVGTGVQHANIYAKASLTLAGVPFAEAIFKQFDCSVAWQVAEGTDVTVTKGQKVVLGVATGPVNRLLQVERTVLEVLTRCSACATVAKKAKQVADSVGYKGLIAGTRKTTPGRFRLVEKYALMVAGVDTHRYSLSNMVMLKDNHIDACGGIATTVKRTRQLAGFATKIEVECRSLPEAFEATEAGADVVMLDNFGPGELGRAALELKAKYPYVIVEISGGYTPDNIGAALKEAEGVDVVSMGCLTQGVPSVDISMKIAK